MEKIMPQYGVNIDPNNPRNGTPNAGTLGSLKADGVHWVRLVFNAEPLGGMNLDQLCQRYGQIIMMVQRSDFKTPPACRAWRGFVLKNQRHHQER